MRMDHQRTCPMEASVNPRKPLETNSVPSTEILEEGNVLGVGSGRHPWAGNAVIVKLGSKDYMSMVTTAISLASLGHADAGKQ